MPAMASFKVMWPVMGFLSCASIASAQANSYTVDGTAEGDNLVDRADVMFAFGLSVLVCIAAMVVCKGYRNAQRRDAEVVAALSKVPSVGNTVQPTMVPAASVVNGAAPQPVSIGSGSMTTTMQVTCSRCSHQATINVSEPGAFQYNCPSCGQLMQARSADVAMASNRRGSNNSKIVFGIAACMAIAGVVVFVISAVAPAGASVSVRFQAVNTQSVTLTASEGSGDLGFSLHIKSVDRGQCSIILASTSVSGPSGYNPEVWGHCNNAQEKWEVENDPPLRRLGHFYIHEEDGVKVYGDYTVTSSAGLWIRDIAEDFGKADGSNSASLGFMAVAIALVVISLILCLVWSCCMGEVADKLQQAGADFWQPIGASA